MQCQKISWTVDSFCIYILCVLLSRPEPLCKVEKEMVNICAVCDCFSKDPSKAAFKIPKDLEQRRKWLKFLNRQDLPENMKYIYICELHFEEKFLNQNENRVRLINKMQSFVSLCRVKIKWILLYVQCQKLIYQAHGWKKNWKKLYMLWLELDFL